MMILHRIIASNKKRVLGIAQIQGPFTHVNHGHSHKEFMHLSKLNATVFWFSFGWDSLQCRKPVVSAIKGA